MWPPTCNSMTDATEEDGMAKVERVRQEIQAPLDAEELKRQTGQGWKMVAIEWERELPEEQAEKLTDEVPFGLQVSASAGRLEENPIEREALFLMMELTIQDGPYPVIAEELNRRGYRTRQGMKWTPISVFQMLPRLIDIGPQIFATQEWQERRKRMAVAGTK